MTVLYVFILKSVYTSRKVMTKNDVDFMRFVHYLSTVLFLIFLFSFDTKNFDVLHQYSTTGLTKLDLCLSADICYLVFICVFAPCYIVIVCLFLFCLFLFGFFFSYVLCCSAILFGFLY